MHMPLQTSLRAVKNIGPKSKLNEDQLKKLVARDQVLLQKTRFPIVTVSASFREDLKAFHGMGHDPQHEDVVFSRAHYSMAFGCAIQAWMKPSLAGVNKQELKKISYVMSPKIHAPCHPEVAWMVDPTNYVRPEDWTNITRTELIGRIIARNPLLKWLKDQVDTIARNNLPITNTILPPLIELFREVKQPIISFHYESGNILAALGKRVVQVVTDPHVRPQYVKHAHLPTIKFAVMDERTKAEFIERASLEGHPVDARRVVVTGPPVDPRIVACRQLRTEKPPLIGSSPRPLRIAITTGGLGTNLAEIQTILEELFDLLRKHPVPVQLLCYAGTHDDFAEMMKEVAKKERVQFAPLSDQSAKLRMIHGNHLVGLNEQLIEYLFPWADLVITKPSGDMAYDAAVAGAGLLFLEPWGEWEENIQHIFEQAGIGRRAQPMQITKQVLLLASHANTKESWIMQAQNKAKQLPPLFRNGNLEILKMAREW